MSSELDQLPEAIAAQANEPLLPVEKKLIAWSLGIGVTLLVVLGIVNHYLPVTVN